VYGDIGTSPLYAMRECFRGAHGVAPTEANVYGVLSLIFWTLITIVTLKYHVYVLRLDNRGEGGILALLGLIGSIDRRSAMLKRILVTLGVFGAALLYGDGMITPAISVLSAVEGLAIATPLFNPYVVPVTVVILVLFFLFQRRGTAGVGAIFGPITLLWFVTIAALGLNAIAKHPAILGAVNPMYAVDFFTRNGFPAFLVLGAVFLVATGGEALYADLGHFGERPIQIDWFTIAAPALLLQYFGQGALLIRDPAAAINPFYLLAPRWMLVPLVALATAATIIASQAIVSGAFSLTRQAIQLGYLPRMEIVHTSSVEIGQIYIPTVNRALMVASVVLVAGFRSSSNVAAAYGVAVSTTMIITTLLAYIVTRDVRGWSRLAAGCVTGAFLIADLAFLIANYAKIGDGGWFPLLVAACVFVLMTTWRRGREILTEKLREGALHPQAFIRSMRARPPVRVPGTAVFMHRNPDAIPSSLLHSLKHYKVLHERVILLTLLTEDDAYISGERFSETELGHGITRVAARYGYMEDIDVPQLLAFLDPMETTYFLGRESLVVTDRPSGMATWREKIFAGMMRNAAGAASYFRLPPNRVVELGAQIEF
jgi:KUP system potassium uptake protein